MPVFFAVSCDRPGKETAKKIHMTYYVDEDGEKYPWTEYVWNGNKIDQVIDYNNDGSIWSICYYTYEGDKLASIKLVGYEEDEESYTDEYIFTWNGNKIEKFANIYLDEPLCTTYCEYTGDDITSMKIKLDVLFKGAKKVATRKGRVNPMVNMLQNLTARAAKNGAKEESEYDMVVDYTYANGNIVKLSTYRPDNEEYVVTYEYTFDDKVNFMKGIWAPSYYQNPLPFSKNNYVAVYAYDTEDNGMGAEYDYLYDEDGYPTAMRQEGADYSYAYEYTK